MARVIHAFLNSVKGISLSMLMNVVFSNLIKQPLALILGYYESNGPLVNYHYGKFIMGWSGVGP